MVFGLHRCVFHCFGTRTTILSTGTCDTFRADCPPTGWTNKFVRGDPEVRHKGLWNVEGAPSRPSGNEVAPGTPFAYTALGVPRGWPRSSWVLVPHAHRWPGLLWVRWVSQWVVRPVYAFRNDASPSRRLGKHDPLHYVMHPGWITTAGQHSALCMT